MRTVFITAAAALLLAFAGHGLSRAALTDASGTSPPPMEVLVFEHPDCVYCPVFRNRIAERYKHSLHASEAPLRFVDITSTQAKTPGLKEPISMVPTAVVMKGGREVDRIPGLWSPDHFFKMVTFIIRSVD
jgi:thioredoxin-related protein